MAGPMLACRNGRLATPDRGAGWVMRALADGNGNGNDAQAGMCPVTTLPTRNQRPPVRQTRSTAVDHAVVGPCRPNDRIGQSLCDACCKV
jgi:hypothetical protein